MIPSLVLKLKTEIEEIQELILDTLTCCLRVEAFEALATGAVHILKNKLQHSCVAIRSRAAQALMTIWSATRSGLAPLGSHPKSTQES